MMLQPLDCTEVILGQLQPRDIIVPVRNQEVLLHGCAPVLRRRGNGLVPAMLWFGYPSRGGQVTPSWMQKKINDGPGKKRKKEKSLATCSISICLDEDCCKTLLCCSKSTILQAFGCWRFPSCDNGNGTSPCELVCPGVGSTPCPPAAQPTPWGPRKDWVRTECCLGLVDRENAHFSWQFIPHKS